MIYFVRDADGGRIKIGTTIRLSERLKQLAAEHGDGLEVLAIVAGSHAKERRLHRKFAHLRVVGEWFEPGDDLLGFIVSDGKPWDESDDAPLSRADKTVKIDRTVADMASFIADRRGLTIAEYLTDLLREPITRDFDKEIKRAKGESE